MAKGKEFKKPKAKDTSNLKIKEPESTDYDSLKPTFSFQYMKYQSPNCISQCQEDKKALILSTLLKLSQSTWKDIGRLPKEQGFELMPRFRFKVPVPMPPSTTPDTKILVARYDDGGRLAGYRSKDVYHVVLVGKDLYSH